MQDLYDFIAQCTEENITDLVEAVRKRYSELFPDWEIMTLAIERRADTEQLFHSIRPLLLSGNDQKEDISSP